MKENTDKCHLIISSNDSSEVKRGNLLIKGSNCKNFLGVKIDTKMTFDDHIKDLSRKANSKLGALGTVTLYMRLAKKNYKRTPFLQHSLTLIWMFHSRSNNNKIISLHERCLRLIYNDKSSSYEELFHFILAARTQICNISSSEIITIIIICENGKL